MQIVKGLVLNLQEVTEKLWAIKVIYSLLSILLVIDMYCDRAGTLSRQIDFNRKRIKPSKKCNCQF